MVPLFFGLLAHGLCIRFRALRAFTVPIAPGALGANKTWRGIVCVAAGTALGFAIVRPGVVGLGTATGLALLGFAVGACAMAAELPNSLLKRRLGIAPGTQAAGLRGAAFHLLDQVDLVVGAWVILAFRVAPTPARIAGSLALAYVGHQLVSAAGYWLGMRTSAR